MSSASAADPNALQDEHAALRTELAARDAELAALRAETEDLLRAVSHDLRAPLRHLGAFGNLLQERIADLGGDAEAEGYLDTMRQSAKQLGRMVDGLLEISRIGRAPLDLQPLNLAALVREAQQRCLQAAAEPAHAARIEWRIADGFPPARGDAALLRQLLENLLSNALKFTRPRPVACIGVAWSALPTGGCEIAVLDNGVGFDPARAGKLFGVFERLHSASEFDGLGIGLAAAQRIVRRHGGRIGIDGMPDGGCTVRFVLP